MSATLDPAAASLPEGAARYRRLLPGDPSPRFEGRTRGNSRYVFDSAAGRYIVLGFVGAASDEAGQRMASFPADHPELFSGDRCIFFGVTVDPADEQRLEDQLPDRRWFWDFDAKISSLYGSAPVETGPGANRARRLWVVVDPRQRVHAVIPVTQDGSDQAELAAVLKHLPPVGQYGGIEIMAPVLFLPGVFERDLCERLIAAYKAVGGRPTGFMTEVDGKTVEKLDPNHKRRRDVILEDRALIAETQERVHRRIRPEIQHVHCFDATRMERYLVACYSAEEAGHFRAHRDNTTGGTAHRRFAVSINLSDDFDGGEIGFPEYGPRTFKPPVGGAVVFSCSLLHAVSPVTRGERYAFLPFLYDDAAARQREANNIHLGEGVSPYRA